MLKPLLKFYGVGMLKPLLRIFILSIIVSQNYLARHVVTPVSVN
jgi:hypothetical protein